MHTKEYYVAVIWNKLNLHVAAWKELLVLFLLIEIKQQKKVKVLVAQLCLTLCNLMDYSLLGSSVHGILQAWILEWVAFLSPGDLPDPGIVPRSPTLQADFFFFFFNIWATREAQNKAIDYFKTNLKTDKQNEISNHRLSISYESVALGT